MSLPVSFLRSIQLGQHTLAQLVDVRYGPNAASELRDLTSRKQSRAHEEAGSSKWDYVDFHLEVTH